jgi:hypothetical protein
VPIPTSAERLGTCLDGRYELRAILARGGMGVLYEALDLSTGQQVVVKMPRPSESDDGMSHARFAREARLLRRLHHPNVVEVISDGEVDGVPFFAMERLEGQPLSELLMARGRLSPEQTLELLLPIMDAVARAHEAGVIHRDLKPSNVFVQDGGDGSTTPKLLDFGIAKALEGETVTRTGRAVGTPDYMSPEQASGAALDVRTDVWSMAMIVYRCLSGALPFDGPVYEAARSRIALQKRAPELPSRFAAAVDRALGFEASDRYATMRDFALALILTATSAGMAVPHDALSNAQGLRSATSTVQRIGARGFLRRRAAAAIVACVLLAIGVVVWSRGSRPAEPTAEPSAATTQPAAPPAPVAKSPPPAVAPAADQAERPVIAAPPAEPAPHKPSARRASRPAPARASPRPEQAGTPAPAPAEREGALPAVETRW